MRERQKDDGKREIDRERERVRDQPREKCFGGIDS